jgi:hypothetical protein
MSRSDASKIPAHNITQPALPLANASAPPDAPDAPSELPRSQASLQAERDSIESLTESQPPATTAVQFEPGRVLAVVGGRPIMVGDMLYEINELIEEHAAGAPEDIKETQRQQLTIRMLPKFVDRQLIYVDSVRGLPDGADMATINESLGKSFDEEALPKFLKQTKMNSSTEFDAKLRAMGVSLRQFRQAWIDDQFMKYFIGQKLDVKGEVTLAEMREYYDQHISEFQYPSRARWEQLVVRFERVSDRKQAERMIAEMGNEVVYGASLPEVARKRSHDFLAKDGGQQGWITQGSLAAAALDKAIFEIPINTLSDIIETNTGLHIIRVLERTPAGTKPFRDAQVEIKEKLLDGRKEQQFEEYIKRLRREIPIEVVDQSVQLPEGYLTQ